MATEKFTIPQRVTLAAISAIYVLVRFWDLTSSCLWFDEIFGVHAARHSWGEMVWFVAQDLVHPPLFYSLLKLWIAVSGESVSWLRLFPAIVSVLALPPFLYLCRELKLKFLATAAALFFFAWNGALIKYAQEVRMYSLVLFLSIVSVWLFTRFYFRGKNIWVLTLVNVLLIYTHYLGWFLIAAEIAATAGLQRIKIRHVLTMLGIAVAAYIPWVVIIAKAAGGGADVSKNIGWIETPGLSAVFQFACTLVEPFYFQQSSVEPPTKLAFTIPLLAIVLTAVLMNRWKAREDREQIILLLILFGIPTILAFSLSWMLPVSIWGFRHLIFVFPPALILMAILITEVSHGWMKNGLIAATLIIAAAAFTHEEWREKPVFVWCGWEQLASELPAIDGGNEQVPVYVFEDLVAYHLWYSLSRTPSYRVVKINDIDGIIEDIAYFLPRGFDEVEQSSIKEIKKPLIWVAFRAGKLDQNESPLRNFIVGGYEIKETRVIESDVQNAYLVLLERK